MATSSALAATPELAVLVELVEHGHLRIGRRTPKPGLRRDGYYVEPLTDHGRAVFGDVLSDLAIAEHFIGFDDNGDAFTWPHVGVDAQRRRPRWVPAGGALAVRPHSDEALAVFEGEPVG